jgi:hypothetical protein
VSVGIDATKIEANRRRPRAVSVVIERKKLGQIESQVEGNLQTDANTQNPLIHSLGELIVIDNRLGFRGRIAGRTQSLGALTRMAHLSVSNEASKD